MRNRSPETIADYIADFPKNVQARLKKLRQMIKKIVPQAQERIAYGMPTFTLDRNVAHFAGYERHVGLYPGPAAIAAFKKEIAAYKWAKGSIQFPHDEPLPLLLISRIVKFSVRQRLTGAKAKKTSKK